MEHSSLTNLNRRYNKILQVCTTMARPINASTAQYCYMDFDIDQHRSKLARTAAFCHATNTRYGLSSKDLRQLGGSELKRIPELLANDHEWKESSSNVVLHGPVGGNRLVVQLDWNTAPLACENFATLCSNDEKSSCNIGACGKPLTYRNSIIHRIEPNFILQGGDFVFGNGSGGESIFGKKFKDERGGLLKKHDQRGILSMGNSGKNSNTSQFFITFAPTCPQCDGKHVVFGKVISGWEVLSAVEKEQQNFKSSSDPTTTVVSVRITDCGIWTPFVTAAAGYWYDTPDPESYTGVSPVFMVQARVAVVVLGSNNKNATGVITKLRDVLILGRHCADVQAIEVDEEKQEDAIETVTQLLSSLAIDVVLCVPACWDTVGSKLELPETWKEKGISTDKSKVILQAKPVQAVEMIRTKSWLASNY